MYSAWCGPLFMSSEKFEEYTFSIQQPTTHFRLPIPELSEKMIVKMYVPKTFLQVQIISNYYLLSLNFKSRNKISL